MIPRRFIRIWPGGGKPIPELFENWWRKFQAIHPAWEFITITEARPQKFIPIELLPIYDDVDTYAGRSDILRLTVLHQLGGIFIDTDVMPIRSFEPLISIFPFAGKRSGRSFESAIIGCPAGHPAMSALLEKLPLWYWTHQGRSASVRTGPAFLSSVWFGRDDVVHLPVETFYPYNGFMAPKREDKMRMFSDIRNFPENMLAAHFSNHKWGGKPKD